VVVKGFKAYWPCNGGWFEYYPHIDKVGLCLDGHKSMLVDWITVNELVARYGEPYWM
jgi:hypothetical protein